MLSLTQTSSDKKQFLRQIFLEVLRAVDAKNAVKNTIRLERNNLYIAQNEFNLDKISRIYSIAVGKAACSMAQGLSEGLGEKFKGGVISSPESGSCFLSNWTTFHGGHPTPNDESLLAAHSAIELLQKVCDEKSLIIFLISGGGSAMFELPRDENIKLADLQAMNKVLVTCGATIAEINALRRRISAVKNGGLSRLADKSPKISLIISDTNSGQAFNVASGLTIENKQDFTNAEISSIISRYNLAEKLPFAVFDCLKKAISEECNQPQNTETTNNFAILLENMDALLNAKKNLESADFIVEINSNLIEQEISEGCRIGVERLTGLYAKTSGNKPVAIISGGEFVCPVRGKGVGGRNLESALRTAILFDELKQQEKYQNTKFTALFAGTDGIDGNSSAAGAICDDTTIKRGKKQKLDALKYLRESDSYHYFHKLGDVIGTGATGTNVRDVRILLAL